MVRVENVDCMQPTRTVIETLQPSIGLILRAVSHGAVLIDPGVEGAPCMDRPMPANRFGKSSFNTRT